VREEILARGLSAYEAGQLIANFRRSNPHVQGFYRANAKPVPKLGSIEVSEGELYGIGVRLGKISLRA